jgi:uncharacterized RDD family membrane protein YckC
MTLPPPPPPPSYGAPSSFDGQPNFGQPMAPAAIPFASWGQRVLAALIDGLIGILVSIVFLILTVIFAAVSDGLGGLMALIGRLVNFGLSLYFAFLNGSIGQSPGKKVMGIQVVNANTGQFIGGGLGIVRNFAHIADVIICGIGFLFPLWDAKKQTLADKIMTTVVIAGPKQDFMSAIKSSIPGGK